MKLGTWRWWCEWDENDLVLNSRDCLFETLFVAPSQVYYWNRLTDEVTWEQPEGVSDLIDEDGMVTVEVAATDAHLDVDDRELAVAGDGDITGEEILEATLLTEAQLREQQQLPIRSTVEGFVRDHFQAYARLGVGS